MNTFAIVTLGCKVNQYESEQIASLLRARGLRQVERAADADLRVVNTCSVTLQAAGKSRQAVRRMTRRSSHPLPVLQTSENAPDSDCSASVDDPAAKVLVTGCWATSNPADAQSLPGVTAVLGHHDDVAARLDALLANWRHERPAESDAIGSVFPHVSPPPGPETPALATVTTPTDSVRSKEIPGEEIPIFPVKTGTKLSIAARRPGTTTLPQLDARHTGHQRAFLKVQDGCDAHCTYCIIPSLRPSLWSKSPDHAVEEARRLVQAGHSEIVLTGIFLGAYGQPTALRRRQEEVSGRPLGRLVEALCTRVPGLERLRLSSLEPGDLGAELLAVFRSFPQVVPHFHLPLQSGSDPLLKRMNRQYTRDDFLRMVEAVRASFDRPAITTDIIVGFPGESDEEFEKTLDVVDRVRFIHTHAFSYSPRPGTAAARWRKEFVRGPVVNDRIEMLQRRAADHSHSYRTQFVGETVELLVERPGSEAAELQPMAGYQHGRCERYFAVHFQSEQVRTGEAVRVRVEQVTPERTIGSLV